MKFRDEDNLKPIILTSLRNGKYLERQIEQLGQEYDIIDLQYSSTTVGNVDIVEYSALALVRKKDK